VVKDIEELRPEAEAYLLSDYDRPQTAARWQVKSDPQQPRFIEKNPYEISAQP
jgi:hypothetical protein